MRSATVAAFTAFTALTALTALTVPSVAHAEVTVAESTPYRGVVHIVRTDDAIPAHLHLVRINLTSAELRLLAPTERDRGMTTSAWADAAGAELAISGDLFDPFSFTPAGLAAGDGLVWPGSSDDAAEGFIWFTRSMSENFAMFELPESIVDGADLDSDMLGVVGGRPLYVLGGVPVATFPCDDLLALPCERAPRAAVGLTEDERTLLLAVVDGWQAGSIGLTAAEFAEILAAEGAHIALGLDPGASSALYIESEGGVVTSPSDGTERRLANHLGVSFTALANGRMIGFVRARDVFDATANLVGAQVQLDNGRGVTTDLEGLFQFADLTPRHTCATASHTGYRSVTQCRLIPSGDEIYNSIALFPNSDFIDAGPLPPDAAPPDARAPTDAAPAQDDASTDATSPLPPAPSACACHAVASRRTTPTQLLLLPALLLLTAAARARSRRRAG